MGGGPSKKAVAGNLSKAKADQDLKAVTEALEISDKDLTTLATLFAKIDKSGNGSINQHELFKYFKLEYDELTGKLFKSMDAQQAGAQAELDMIELILAFYNFLTCTIDGLTVLTFKVSAPRALCIESTLPPRPLVLLANFLTSASLRAVIRH